MQQEFRRRGVPRRVFRGRVFTGCSEEECKVKRRCPPVTGTDYSHPVVSPRRP